MPLTSRYLYVYAHVPPLARNIPKKAETESPPIYRGLSWTYFVLHHGKHVVEGVEQSNQKGKRR